MIATKRQMKPDSRQNDCNHEYHDKNLVADKMVATTIRTWWQTVSQWTGAPAWVALRGSNQGLAGWGFENRASPVEHSKLIN